MRVDILVPKPIGIYKLFLYSIQYQSPTHSPVVGKLHYVRQKWFLITSDIAQRIREYHKKEDL